MSHQQHPYYAKDDEPPYKLRKRQGLVFFLLPALAAAWLIHKAVGAPYDRVGYISRQRASGKS
ncbi:MAG: hypothetical protein GY838_12945 [bacterium]|nr:hypothetical protein [bacterium]